VVPKRRPECKNFVPLLTEIKGPGRRFCHDGSINGAGKTMAMRAVFKMLALCLVAFAAAFAAQHWLLPDVVPVAWGQEPQPLWVLEAAFLLRSVENVAAMLAVIVIIITVARVTERWWRRPQRAK
jgi:hypothetical protein